MPAASITSAKSNSELVWSLSNLLDSTLLPSSDNEDAQANDEAEEANFSYQSTSRALFIPNPSTLDKSDLASYSRATLDVTVKFFFLPASSGKASPHTLSADYVQHGLDLLSNLTGLQDADTVILQAPGIQFDDEPESQEEEGAITERVAALFSVRR